MSLLLIGLMIMCAKLWFDVGALRVRLNAIEVRREAGWQDDVAAPVPPSARAVHPANAPVPAVDPWPEVPVEALTPKPPTPQFVEPEPEPDSPFRKVHLDPEPAPEEELHARPATRGSGFEDLFGRKLPIWAGGITLAIAGFLIVKYSIDSGLLSPTVRVILGLLFGGGLIVGAEVALRTDDAVRDPRVRQALSGAGIATLYASILVAANLYHLITPLTGFVGMALTTVLAGGLSLRFGAPSAVLGLVGGLAAPALVGSGSPDVPLLSAYLALTVGGLCALSRTQRWMWLGVLALAGGFGWGALLILGGAFDIAATLSIGALTLLFGIGLPLLAFAGERGAAVRLLGSLAACAQLAALVATGGFAPLEWSLYGLVSIAIVWLSRREAGLAELPAAGLAVVLLLVTAWPAPGGAMLAIVMGGTAAIYGLPVVQRVWRRDARLSDAIQLSVIAAAVAALPAARLDLADATISLLALLGAAIVGLTVALGWTATDRKHDPRFALLVTTAATLLATAAMVVAPSWCVAPAIAIVAVGLLILAEYADDGRIDWIAAAFGIASLTSLLLAPAIEIGHAGGRGPVAEPLTAALRWLVPALGAILFAWRSRLPEADKIAQPAAVLLGYVAIAQVTPALLLPLIPITLLSALALGRRMTPAIVAAGALTITWALLPFSTWIAAGAGAMVGVPMLIGALPSLDDTLLRLVLPAAAAAFVAWRRHDPHLRGAALTCAALLAGISLHISFKQLLAIADADGFVRLGMAERTLWEALLAGVALAVWRRAPSVARALAAASIAHFVGFTLILHNPLWTLQAVGEWPVANLLLPAFGTAFALTWLARGSPLPSPVRRAREWLQMALILAFAAVTLRQLVHGSLLSVGDVGEGEDMVRSVLLILFAIGFLRHGIVARLRDWRIASLLLMLAAVAKVFLIDAAGLDGLIRIASFAALGFSLIGIGWLYARYLPEDNALTPDSRLSAMSIRGN